MNSESFVKVSEEPKLEVMEASNLEGEIQEIIPCEIDEEVPHSKEKYIKIMHPSYGRPILINEKFIKRREDGTTYIERNVDDEFEKAIGSMFSEEDVNALFDGDNSGDDEDDGDDSEMDTTFFDIQENLKSITHLVRNIVCEHQKGVLRKCPCMCLFKKGRKYHFDEQSLNDIQAITQDLRLGNFVNVKDAQMKYMNHKIVIIILTTRDTNLTYDLRHDFQRYLKNIYEIREYYGVMNDMGKKSMIIEDEYVAQSFTDIVTGFLDSIKKGAKGLTDGIAGTVKFAVEKVVDSLKSLFGLISQSISNVFGKMVEKVQMGVIKWFDPIERMKQSVGGFKHPVLIGVVVIVLMVIVVDSIGFLTFKLAKSVINKVFDYFFDQEDFVAQAPSDPIAAIIAVFGLILGLTKFDLDIVSKKCRGFINIISAGIGGSWLMGSLFLLLPVALQTALRLKYGTVEDREKEVVDDWLVRASAVIRLRKIPKVLVSEEYFVWLNDLLTESHGLRKTIKSPIVSNVFVRNCVSLMEIMSILENYRKEKSYRAYPFSIHIAAPPGYGKTLITSRLCHDLFGVSQREIYSRPVSSDFWDGFIDQKVIVMDEFLVGTRDDKVRKATEYLELVSTKVFKPNMASVDNPSVGLKGTRAEPIGVVTINNDAYQRVAEIDPDALFRRREFVIQLRIAPGYRSKFVGSKIDFGQFNEREIAEKAWLVFDIKPAVPDSGRIEMEGLSYNELLTLLITRREAHETICAKIKEGEVSEIELDKPPSELLEDVLRELRGIPNEPQSVSEALFSLFSTAGDAVFSTFKAEANDEDVIVVDDLVEIEDKNVIPIEVNVNVIEEDNVQIMDESNIPLPKNKHALVIWKQLKRGFTGKSTKEGAKDKMGKLFAIINEGLQESKADFDILAMKFNCVSKRKGLKYMIDIGETIVNEMDSVSFKSAEDVLQFPVDDLPTQKESVAFVDHSNVNPTKFHRHNCVGLTKTPIIRKGSQMIDVTSPDQLAWEYKICDKQFAHQHEDGTVHKMLCGQCERSGFPEDYREYTGWHARQETVRTKFELLPTFYDYEYIGEPEGFKEKMNKKWMDIYMSKFRDFGKYPIVVLHQDDDQGEPMFHNSFTPRSVGNNCVKSFKKWIGVFIILYAIKTAFKRFLNWNKNKKVNCGDQDEVFCFAQSSKPMRTSTKPSKVKTFYKAQSQSKSNVVKFYIGNVEHVGFPIKGQVFMTYYHAFWRDDKLLPEGTEILIKYAGHEAIVPLSYSMMEVDSENDLVFFKFFDKKMPNFPNLVKRFWSVRDVEDFKSTSCILHIQDTSCYMSVTKSKNKNYSHKNRKIHLEECLLYKCPTKSGDCGSIIMAAGSAFPGKYMGMHVAGSKSGLDSFGIGVIVTQEDIKSALKEDFNIDGVMDDFSAQAPVEFSKFTGPNVKNVTEINSDERVHVGRKTDFRRSCLSEHLENLPKKNLPILSEFDPRNKYGIDPGLRMLMDTGDVDHSNDVINKQLLDRVFADMLHYWDKNLLKPVGVRMLTMKEAIEGIPGKLSGMNIKSSAGYPLALVSSSNGKERWMNYYENWPDLWINPSLGPMVGDFMGEVYKTDIDIRGRFLAFMKDELVSDKKIEECRTRMIYCGDMRANIVFRMFFGYLLSAFNQSYESTPSAIGLNQYSHDMHMMYDYLSEIGENFVAGDFKNFDKNIQPQFQKKAYELLMNLVPDDIASKTVKKNFMYHQMHSYVQYENLLIEFKNTHLSGCFFTTIVNNLVHEAYVRYIFAKLCPTKFFLNEVRMKLLGDDHIYCFSDAVKGVMNPFNIRDEMKLLGQIYTSDVKDQELTNNFRSFEDITFLGAHPRLIKGKYCGALKKDTLWEMLHWTRNRDKCKDDEVEMAIELASVWEKEFFFEFVTEACYAMSYWDYFGTPFIRNKENKTQGETQEIVASRTAVSGETYDYGFYAQGPVMDGTLNKHSLVDMTSGETVVGAVVNQSMPQLFKQKALNEVPMDLKFGTDSRVLRSDFSWSTSDAKGTTIFSVDVPFGIIGLGDNENLQNMAFDRFAFWKGDVEAVFQINATTFQCGLLCAYFVPLGSYKVDIANVTACSHVMIMPDRNATYSLPIPYLYLRSVMNTRARDTESLGYIHVVVLSPFSSTDLDKCNITFCSSFPNSEFTIPRPLSTTSKVKTFYNPNGKSVTVYKDLPTVFEAQGNSTSTTVNNNISNVSGEMPIQGFDTGISSSADIGVEASIPMPLDNPPLCSGSIPVGQTFSGMAASHGVRPTVDLQLKPAALSRQQFKIFDPSDAKISTICGKKCLLTSTLVSTSMMPGTSLYECTLNTRMNVAEGSGIPINIIALNQFIFWRADIEFEFNAVITKYHSMRLQAIVSYGSEGTVSGSSTVNYSKIMNFSNTEMGVKYSDSWCVKYNAQTEWLRTYEGERATDLVQNYSLGAFKLKLQNALIAPETVAPSVEVLIFVRFGNVKVAVPRPMSPFTINNDLVYTSEGLFSYVGRSIDVFNNVIDCSDAIFTAPNLIKIPIANFNFLNIPPPANYVQWDTEQRSLLKYTYGSNTTDQVVYALSYLVDATSVTVKINIDITVSDPTMVWIRNTPLPLMSIVPPVFEAQSNEDEKVVIMELPTSNDTDTHSGDATTLEVSPHRPNIPCKLEIGEKMEFCVSDIHEVARRYIRVVPGTNSDLQQYTVISENTGEIQQTINNIGVQPQNFWRSMFAAWAGSIKYRIFSKDVDISQVTFVPYFNSDSARPGIPIIDAFSGSRFVYDTVGVTTDSFLSGNLAREVSYPISSKSYIDVSAPFQSHFNFCYTDNTQSIAPISSGTLSIVGDPSGIKPIIFTAAGDDMRFGVFRPPRITNFDMSTYKNGIGGFYN